MLAVDVYVTNTFARITGTDDEINRVFTETEQSEEKKKNEIDSKLRETKTVKKHAVYRQIDKRANETK